MANKQVTAQDQRRFGQGEIVQCPFQTVTEAFYHQARTSPSCVAIKDLSASQSELTYGEVALRAQTLAETLHELGVGPGDRVPLLVKRGWQMIVGIWAILSCGAQYVPLDGGVVPDSTIRHVVEQTGSRIVLCLESTEYRLHDLGLEVKPVRIDEYAVPHTDTFTSDGRVVDLATADGGCYVIYTSGTTGRPKGVDVTHRNVANIVCLSPGNLNIGPGKSVGSLLNISFDMAAWEIFACLCNGGTLVIRGSSWEAALQQIDVMICTPSILSKYHPDQFPRIKTVATAGEPTSQSLADLWASHGTYWNCCGPTETTIVNTMHRHIPGQPLSIGAPTPNNTVYILDENRQMVTPGNIGVMWAGGHGVSRGYIGLPEKTSASYVPDHFASDGSRMYLTGDLGRWRPDGNIEILGRADDQVKVKGFRVELDGISASLASCPGVERAITLLIDGKLHGFVCPQTLSTEFVRQHVSKVQPYYAVPSDILSLPVLPITANGKIDKQALRLLAKEPLDSLTKSHVATSIDSDQGTLVEMSKTLSRSPSSTLDGSVEEIFEKDELRLDLDIPDKQWSKPLRGLRHRIFIVYRVLFSLMGICNLAALVAILVTQASPTWLTTLTAINLLVAVLIRQDVVINILYTASCSVPKSAPLWLRRRCAKIYHLGGIHSSAGIFATLWLVGSTIRSTVVAVSTEPGTDSIIALVLSWLIVALCCVLIIFALPSFRKKNHNVFERIHRFVGWTVVALFWARTIVSVKASTPAGEDMGEALLKNPGFWLLGVATCSIASSWLFLRKVPVTAEPLSDHATKLTFTYTVPVNGSFTRLSRRPLLEWHSFATIPIPKTNEINARPGYSLVVSNAGDWTRSCIRESPTHLWVRGLPTCGVMRIATLFNRLVVIATGSGIGPLLGHISQPSCPTQLIWSTPNPKKTFGQGMIDTIHKTIPQAVIHDTKLLGRPDLVKMGYNLAKDFRAEAVIVIANEKITKKIVYGLETRGFPAYGAIWDS